jgi:hypothetical protein
MHVNWGVSLASLVVRSSSATRLLLGVVATGLVAAPVLAHPPAPITDDGRPIGGKVHTWMHAAKVPLVGGRVQIRREGCPGYPTFVGCVISSRPRTLYLRHGSRRPRAVLYHELGHVFDIRVLNGHERRRFKRILGVHSGWFEGGLPPAEWFADGYATCAKRRRLSRRATPTAYGYAPTIRQHARVCRLIQAAAAPRGRPPQLPANPPAVIEVAPPPPEQTEGGGGPICTLVDELFTDCRPPAALP